MAALIFLIEFSRTSLRPPYLFPIDQCFLIYEGNANVISIPHEHKDAIPWAFLITPLVPYHLRYIIGHSDDGPNDGGPTALGRSLFLLSLFFVFFTSPSPLPLVFLSPFLILLSVSLFLRLLQGPDVYWSLWPFALEGPGNKSFAGRSSEDTRLRIGGNEK